MIANLTGEWTKTVSTRAPLATAALALAMLAGVGAGRVFTSDSVLSTPQLLQGAGTGMLIVLVLGAVAAATEYTHGTHPLTLLADTSRGRFLLAKSLAVAVVSAAAAAVGATALTVVGAVVPGVQFEWTAGDLRPIWILVPVWAMCGVVGVAIGTLVRRAAPAATLAVLWPMALEPLMAEVPWLGDHLAAWLPFRNATRLYQPGSVPAELAHGPWTAFAVFALFTVVLAGAAALVDAARNG